MTSSKRSMNEEDMESSLMSESPSDSRNKSRDIPFCGCLSVQYYQPYFDVDTAEVLDRLMNSITFFAREQTFLTLVGDRPDAYGPFWISTSLVFSIAVCSHISGWLSSWLTDSQWVYDFQSILTSISLVYTFAFVAPLVLWGVFRQLDKNMQFVTCLCLYGYSLVSFLPAVTLCLLPYEFSTWLSLLGCAILSSLFLLKNLAPYIVNHAKEQAAALLGLIGVMQLSFVVSLKIYFF